MFYKYLITYTFITLLFLNSCSRNNKEIEIDKFSEFRNTQIAKTKDPNILVLQENKFANLFLSNSDELSEQIVFDLFSDYNLEIKSNEGYNESGPITYFSAWKGQSIFILIPNKEMKGVKQLSIQTPAIVDEYGVSMGMSFDELNSLRPDLSLSINPFTNNPILSRENSNISYEFCCISDNNVRIDSVQQLEGMEIQNIIWQSSLTEF